MTMATLPWRDILRLLAPNAELVFDGAEATYDRAKDHVYVDDTDERHILSSEDESTSYTLEHASISLHRLQPSSKEQLRN